jgi:hypothetical protein
MLTYGSLQVSLSRVVRNWRRIGLGKVVCRTLRRPEASLAACLLVVCIGCGGQKTQTPPPPPQNPQAIAITAQPQNQALRLGQPASFTVTVTGDAPSYQWSKNGVAISGATSSTLSIPVTEQADNNSTITVTVSNSVNSVTSRSATLVLNAPKAGDLRFQQVDADITLNGYIGVLHTNIGNLLAFSEGDYGSPLELEPVPVCAAAQFDCAWFFNLFATGASGFTTGYSDDAIENFAADVGALGEGAVVTSLDLQRGSDIYAISWVRNSQSIGFNPLIQSVSSADVQSAATTLAGQSQVITGIAFDSGNVTLLSYGWQSDPATVYEAKVITAATLDDIPGAASTLAGEGYIITAVGGHPSAGFLLVGTRVQGDTMPRPLKIVVSPTDDVKTQLWEQGYALITSFTNASVTTETWIGEK